MLKLSTKINIPKNILPFDENIIFTGIGSCFSQRILDIFSNLAFSVSQNPMGIVYNAVSISQSIQKVLDGYRYKEEDFFKHNNLWHSWEHHGSFSSTNLSDSISATNNSLYQFRKLLINSNIVIITFSSSVVYELISEGNKIVANCHKVANKEFNRRILSVNENINAIKSIVNNIHRFNKNINIICTLSPIRHYPGDLVLNAISKAHLLTAIHKAINDKDNIFYFPAYEIVLDELRDYRFFKEDMLHPSDLAVKIIFERFLDTFFDKKANEIIKKREKNYRHSLHKNNN